VLLLLLLAVAVAASGWRERRKKKMTCGARVSVTGEMKYTPAVGPRLCPYIFSGIFVGNEEL